MIRPDQRCRLHNLVDLHDSATLKAALAATSRASGSPALEKVAEQLAAPLQKAGAHSVELQTVCWGPEHRYFNWAGQRTPVVHQAELWLVYPDGSEQLLFRNSERPGSVCSLRATTGDGDGETFEVVDAGLGSSAADFRRHRVHGKVALVSGHHPVNASLFGLVEAKAAGLLYGPGADAGVTAAPPLDPALLGDHRPFAFALTAHQHRDILALLASGQTVRVRVQVALALHNGQLPLLCATVNGTDLAQQRILVLVDLAGGTGPEVVTLLQALRTLTAGVVTGEVAPPNRSIQWLFVPGHEALIGWLHEHRDDLPNVVAALQLSPATGGCLQIYQDHTHAPTMVADLGANHLGVAPTVRSGFALSTSTLMYGAQLDTLSDSEIGVAAAEIAIPICTRDRDAQTAAAQRQTVVALAATALDLASLQQDDLPALYATVQLNGIDRLRQRAQSLRCRGASSAPDVPLEAQQASDRMWFAERSMDEGLRRERQVLASCARVAGGAGHHALLEAETLGDIQQLSRGLTRALQAEIRSQARPGQRLTVKRRHMSAPEERAAAQLVRRQWEGPAPLPLLLREIRRSDQQWLVQNLNQLQTQPLGYLLLQWVDSKRTVFDIVEQLQLDHPQADLPLLSRYIELLSHAGLVTVEAAD